MDYQIKTRASNEVISYNENRFTKFLYNTFIGRCILKLLTLPGISKLGGIYMDSSLSKKKINRFIKQNKINLDDYIKEDYPNFNAFFTRKINPNKRLINYQDNVLISPSDAKLMVYKIDKQNVFKIKHSYYQIKDLCQEEVNDYQNGYALVFRLGVDDYHHYAFIDDGYLENENVIKGKLHTVRPIATQTYPVFIQNERQSTVLHTKHFGDVVMIEVGAMMVGKIINLKDNYSFKKGEEKGYFKFGGSTIILLIKNNIVIDQDIMKNSQMNIETIVKLGEKIGIKKS